MMVSAMHDDE